MKRSTKESTADLAAPRPQGFGHLKHDEIACKIVDSVGFLSHPTEWMNRNRPPDRQVNPRRISRDAMHSP